MIRGLLGTENRAEIKPPAVVILAFGIGLIVALISFGSQFRVLSAAEWKSAIDQENKDFCNKFGIGPDTSRFAECAASLNEIRKKNDRRSAASIL